MKRVVLALFSAFGAIWRLVPRCAGEHLASALFLLESRSGKPEQTLGRLFAIKDRLELIINERAMAYGAGVHPKHRLMRYHDFFVNRIPENAHVLDIGCGYGAVARSIASRVPGSQVVGVDLNQGRLTQAMRDNHLDNLGFITADATTNLPQGHWDVVVMSNVLEHVKDRVGLLRAISGRARPSKFLIRVPMFERDWTIPMRKELGVGYFSDPEHFIEHTAEELDREIRAAGLIVAERVSNWGEYWLECRPATDGHQNEEEGG